MSATDAKFDNRSPVSATDTREAVIFPLIRLKQIFFTVVS
jgi:hypothetical protein